MPADGEVVALQKRGAERALRKYACVDGWYVKRAAEFRYLRSASPPRRRFRRYRWRWICAYLGLVAAAILLLAYGATELGGVAVGVLFASYPPFFEYVLEPNSILTDGELMWLHVRASDLEHDGPRDVARLSIVRDGRVREFSMRLESAAINLVKRDGSIDVLAVTSSVAMQPRSTLGARAIAFREHSEHAPASGTLVALPRARLVGTGGREQ